MTSLFGRRAAGNKEQRSDEGKGKASVAVNSQTAGCEPKAGSGRDPRKGRMPRARRNSADVRCRKTETFGFASKNLLHKFFTTKEKSEKKV